MAAPYDNAGQLTGASGSRTETYSYDSGGNRATSGYTTAAANCVTASPGFTYTYDDEGNRSTRTDTSTHVVTSYSYDYRDRLTTVTVGGTVAARYTYDPLDRRIGIQDNGIQTWVVWDGQQPYADFNGAGALQERYLYGPAVDELLARTDPSGTTSWYLTDRAGSVRNLADSSGTVTGTISYDGFGKVLSSSGAVDRFGYTGREYDPTTGLQSNRERYYDAALGRWTQEDKIGFAGRDPNLERYVGNSPTNASDPSGLDAFDYVPIFGGLFAFMDYLSTQTRESARGRALDEQRAQLNLANNPSQGPYENRTLGRVDKIWEGCDIWAKEAIP